MKEVPLSEFKRRSFKIFDDLGVDRLRVRSRGSSLYLNVYIHDEKDDWWEDKGDAWVDKTGKMFKKCRLCKSIHNIKYVVPYDASFAPGAYCYRCRKKHSIMDVKDAKRFGKIL